MSNLSFAHLGPACCGFFFPSCPWFGVFGQPRKQFLLQHNTYLSLMFMVLVMYANSTEYMTTLQAVAQ